jgi:SulP family sulfate permease
MAGLAVTIVVSQLPDLFGFEIDGGNLVEAARGFLSGLGETDLAALGIGLLALGIVVGLRRLRPRAPGILVAVVVTIVLSALLTWRVAGSMSWASCPRVSPRPPSPMSSSRTCRCSSAAPSVSRW